MVISFVSHSVTLFALFSVLWSQGSGLPAEGSDPGSRTPPHSDGHQNEFSEMLDDLTALEFLVSLIRNSTRAKRRTTGLPMSEDSKILDQVSAMEFLESLIRDSPSAQDDEVPSKRHTDSIFTDNFSRLRKKIAAKKFIEKLLSYGRRRDEDTDDLGYTEPLGDE